MMGMLSNSSTMKCTWHDIETTLQLSYKLPWVGCGMNLAILYFCKWLLTWKMVNPSESISLNIAFGVASYNQVAKKTIRCWIFVLYNEKYQMLNIIMKNISKLLRICLISIFKFQKLFLIFKMQLNKVTQTDCGGWCKEQMRVWNWGRG